MSTAKPSRMSPDVVPGQVPAEHAPARCRPTATTPVSVAVLSSDTQPEPLMSDRPEDPARDACAEDGAEHDADGLTHLHHAGVDEADDHDGRGRGRLDHGGDAVPSRTPLSGVLVSL